ncbi:MAG: GGDEF domain-containing protein [Oscillospiraceae bacterium]|nr:GGDEF domain-containing protein [Oscillospiraceae bacterium]
MQLFLYAEVEIVCALFLGIILSNLRRRVGREHALLAFERLVVSVIVMLLLDIVWMGVQGYPSPGRIAANTAVNVLYMTLSCLNNYFWLYYVETYIGTRGQAETHFRAAAWAPAATFALMALSVPTGWCFYIDDGNIYRHGPLYFLIALLLYINPMLGVVRLLRSMTAEEDAPVRAEKRSLLLFSFTALFSGTLGILFNNLPTTFPCISVGLFFVYVDLQEHSISTDSLTGINNRMSFDRWIWKLCREPDAHFFLFMIDIDGFKEINDVFGHAEGDRALVSAAELLNRAVRNTRCFLARYGGDEFVITGRFASRAQAQEMVADIEALFTGFDWASRGGYAVTVSAGIGEYGPGAAASAKEVIAAADAAMYEEKRKKGGGRDIPPHPPSLLGRALEASRK